MKKPLYKDQWSGTFTESDTEKNASSKKKEGMMAEEEKEAGTDNEGDDSENDNARSLESKKSGTKWPCPDCDRVFDSSSAYGGHRRIHSPGFKHSKKSKKNRRVSNIL